MAGFLTFLASIWPTIKEATKGVALFFAGVKWRKLLDEIDKKEKENAALKSRLKIEREVNSGGTPERVRKFYVDKPKT